MKRLIGKVLSRIAPRTYQNLRLLSEANHSGDDLFALLADYETEVRELRAELNEVRRDNRRVVELYDLVFERLQDDMPLTARPVASDDGRHAS
ncbi:hypothetical protein [Agromyces binzhouensis]|uniref:hypothetical protein n=1 Tax=Agromyces binzhouensis TaxID=1817495 RepID=UPI003625C6E3